MGEFNDLCTKSQIISMFSDRSSAQGLRKENSRETASIPLLRETSYRIVKGGMGGLLASSDLLIVYLLVM